MLFVTCSPPCDSFLIIISISLKNRFFRFFKKYYDGTILFCKRRTKNNKQLYLFEIKKIIHLIRALCTTPKQRRLYEKEKNCKMIEIKRVAMKWIGSGLHCCIIENCLDSLSYISHRVQLFPNCLSLLSFLHAGQVKVLWPPDDVHQQCEAEYDWKKNQAVCYVGSHNAAD